MRVDNKKTLGPGRTQRTLTFDWDRWSAPWQGKNIVPEPVREVVVSRETVETPIILNERLDTPHRCKRCGERMVWGEVTEVLSSDILLRKDEQERIQKSVGRWIPFDADGGRHICSKVVE